MMPASSRPIAVTTVVLLDLIEGIVSLVAGIGFAVFASSLAIIALPLPVELGVVFGMVMAAAGVVYLVVAYGLLSRREWARSAAVALSVLGLVLGGVGLATSAVLGSAALGLLGLAASITGLLINILAIYLLARHDVQQHFLQSATREYQIYPPQLPQSWMRYGAFYVQPALAPSPEPACPICRDAVVYVEQYGRWYCSRCSKYV